MNDTRPISQSRLPSVDQVLRAPTGALATARFGHEATVNAIRKTLAVVRIAVREGGAPAADAASIAVRSLQLLEHEGAPSLRRVFNLTGTVLHTNLGRAVLPESAIAAAVDAMRSAVALEYDVGGAARGERDDHVRGLIRELTGAEDAAIVNNNAAAVLLVLNTFGLNKDAIVSRGELIEIGGSFRLPDIMARAGARLVDQSHASQGLRAGHRRQHRADPQGAHLQLPHSGVHQVSPCARVGRPGARTPGAVRA